MEENKKHTVSQEDMWQEKIGKLEKENTQLRERLEALTQKDPQKERMYEQLERFLEDLNKAILKESDQISNLTTKIVFKGHESELDFEKARFLTMQRDSRCAFMSSLVGVKRHVDKMLSALHENHPIFKFSESFL